MKSFSILIFCLFMTKMIAQNESIDAFLEKWQNSKVYLLDIAKAMPEDKYNYKPTERDNFCRTINSYQRKHGLADPFFFYGCNFG